jgi:hypothetical protein
VGGLSGGGWAAERDRQVGPVLSEIGMVWCLTLNKSIFKMYLNEEQSKTKLVEIEFRKI